MKRKTGVQEKDHTHILSANWKTRAPSYSFFGTGTGTVCEKETLSTKSVQAFFCCTAEVFTTRDEDVRETLHQTSAAADLFRLGF